MSNLLVIDFKPKSRVSPQDKAATLASEASAIDHDPEQEYRAEELYLEALRLDPTNYEALVNLSALYYNWGNHSQSEILNLRALSFHPDGVEAAHNLGSFYLNQKKLLLAEAYLTLALEVDENYAYAHVGMCQVHMRWGRYTAALQHCNHYLRLQPEGSYATEARGYKEECESYE